MRTSFDIPDALFRKTKSVASERGISLREFVIAAIQDRLESSEPSWKSAFGKVKREHLKDVDAVVLSEFSKVNLSEWK
jgi:hypothetical protein